MVILPSLHRWRYAKETPRKPKYQTELPTNHLILFTSRTFIQKSDENHNIYTLLGRKLSLNCLFTGRNNNNFDLCRLPGIN